MKIDLSYYISIFWRRFPYFALIAALFTTIGLTMAVMLPAEYQAKATLLVESPQIPDALAASTVQTVVNEQLQVLEQRLSTRANLIETATRLNVFADQPELSAGEIVSEMRERTDFRAESGRNSATFFHVTFRGGDPALVARVTNEFVTMILDENVRMRTGQAGGTLEFFEEEVDRLSAELDAQSSEILKFKTEHSTALPENREFLTSRQSSLLDSIAGYERLLESLEEQKARAQELFNSTGIVDVGAMQDPDQIALNEAQRKLDEALLVFSENNPRLQILEARVRQMQERVNAGASGTGEEEGQSAVSGPQAVLNAQLADIDQRIADLSSMIEAANSELKAIETSLVEIPANGIVIESLQREYDNTQSQYQQAASRLSTAATGERIELLSKGQRIIVLEQATVPESPSKPNRKLIAAAGLGTGLFFGLGVILLLELLNRSIRRPAEISDKLGITPFAVLPLIRTDQEKRLRRIIIFSVLALFVIGVPLAMWTFHTLVMPLDSLVERFLNRVGLTLTSS